MEPSLIVKFLTPLLFSIVFFSLGYAIMRRRRPLAFSTNTIFIVFLIPVFSFLVRHAVSAQASDIRTIVIELSFFLFVALAARSSSGDITFFNASDEVMVRGLEETLREHNLSFQRGPTRGLFAPGVESKTRLIGTLDLPEHKASVRYVINRKQKFGSIKFINKGRIMDFPRLLADLRSRIVSESAEPGSTPFIYFLLGAACFLFPLFRVLSVR